MKYLYELERMNPKDMTPYEGDDVTRRPVLEETTDAEGQAVARLGHLEWCTWRGGSDKDQRWHPDGTGDTGMTMETVTATTVSTGTTVIRSDVPYEGPVCFESESIPPI